MSEDTFILHEWEKKMDELKELAIRKDALDEINLFKDNKNQLSLNLRMTNNKLLTTSKNLGIVFSLFTF